MSYVRKHLSADALHQVVRNSLNKEKLVECERSPVSWQDCIMSGLALFGLKFPSLLQFDEQREDEVISKNLSNLYHVQNAPSDTCMRERLDRLSPANLRRPFRMIFSLLQRGKILEQFKFMDKYYLLSIDGTGQYSSKKVSCKNCCQKHHHNGETTYYHQMLGASIVHPDEKIVIPIAPEPIVNSDGNSKNDCERNAAKRLLRDYRREHPHLKTIVVEDALASNYPHLSLLDELNIEYIIGVKPGDHKYLFEWIKLAKEKEIIITKNKTKHMFHCYYDVPLNDEYYDYRVNVVEYWEEKPNGKKQHFSWVTSFEVTSENVFDIMR